MDAVEELQAAGGTPSGTTSIETISWHYGAQAVVVSIDPKRVYAADPDACPHPCVRTATRGEFPPSPPSYTRPRQLASAAFSECSSTCWAVLSEISLEDH